MQVVGRAPVFLDRFRILGALGWGAQATVFLAFDPVRRRRVAIKTGALAREPDHDGLREEGRLTGRMDHPAVVHLLGAVDVAGAPALVLEHADAGSVRQWQCAHGPMDAALALELALRLAGALEHVHGVGVVHRDVKPGNVLLRSDGTVMLADLGVACAIDGAPRVRRSWTPAFAAPEQLFGRAGDARVDVYGLGATLHRMVSHRAEQPLFRCARVPGMLRGLPEPVADVVRACCSGRPDDRPGDMAAVRRLLAEARAAVPAGERSAWPPPPRAVEVADEHVELLRWRLEGQPLGSARRSTRFSSTTASACSTRPENAPSNSPVTRT